MYAHAYNTTTYYTCNTHNHYCHYGIITTTINAMSWPRLL